MFKTLIAGIVLGAVAAAAGLYYVPIVNQAREHSLISVTPNGGNTEVFYANIPTDRIMIGAPDQETPLPAGLEWPEHELFAHARAELFKIRNSKDAVVGVASRIAASTADGGLIEWVLHLPARGSVYAIMRPMPPADGVRVGDLRAGSHEFANLEGQISEQWIAGDSDVDGGPAGRIQLQTRFVAIAAESSP